MLEMEEKEIRFKLDVEKIMALLSGKTLQFKIDSMPLVVIEPPQGQITMSYEEFAKLKRLASYAEKPYELIELLREIERISKTLTN